MILLDSDVLILDRLAVPVRTPQEWLNQQTGTTNS
jgi:hypothetical protein